MNIEQAKKLKVGDHIVLNGGTWMALTVGNRYIVTVPFSHNSTGGFYINDDDGRRLRIFHGIENFEVITKVKWVPFDADRMSDAIGYRGSQSKKEITQVVAFYIGDCVEVSAVRDLTLRTFGCPHIQLEMQVEDKIEYPCLCWVSSDREKPNKNSASPRVLINYVTDSGGFSEDITTWRYATPLTDDELLEIGLVRAKS